MHPALPVNLQPAISDATDIHNPCHGTMLNAEAEIAMSMHDAWLDAVTFAPLSALLFGRACGEDSMDASLLFLNTAAVCQLRCDNNKVQGTTLSSFLHGNGDKAKLVEANIRRGRECVMHGGSITIGRKALNTSILAIPISSMVARGTIGCVVLLLDKSVLAACSHHLASTPDVDKAADGSMILRRGLRMGTTQDAQDLAAPVTNALLKQACERAMARRYEGLAPLQILPGLLDTTEWIKCLEGSLTEVAA
jgi:hypothetical protein